MGTTECSCSLRVKLVGDGCEVCNPAKALEYAKDTIEDLESQLRETEDCSTLSTDVMQELTNWLVHHEEDIKLGINDFGDLRSVFVEATGRGLT